MRILFTGGGTGGHFFPIIATIRELKKKAEAELILGLELYYMGPDDFAGETLRREGVVEIKIMSGKIRRYFSLQNFVDVFKIAGGIIQALWNFFLIMPDVVFSKGGYGALPAIISAVIFRIPVIIHESDAVPGKVNQFSARFARRVGLAFSSAASYFPKNKMALVGIPIRKRIMGGSLETAKENLKIFSNQPVLGFIGASQGSQKLNDAVLGVLKELTDDFEVVHQCGAKNFEETAEEGKVILEKSHSERYHPFGFLDEEGIRDFYLVSNLIISRAGASSIFEIAAWGKPSILIPLSGSAQDHQRKNAYAYAGEGAAMVIEEANLTPHVLLGEIRKVAADKELLRSMAQSAQKFARIDSAEIIAGEILKLGEHR